MLVLARIQTAFQLELPVRAMFEAPTIAELARVIDKAGVATAMPPLVPVQERPATLPLSFAQQRLLFLQQLHGAGAAYHIPVAMRLRGDLSRACLQQAVDILWQRHEVLRASFSLDNEGEAVQRIDAAPTLPIAFIDCAPPDLQARLDADADRPFDLEQGPLLRVNLYRLGAREHVLLVTLHHIIADGWSLGLWWRELAAAYRAALAGTPPQLPPLPVQYVDYALWQRRALAVPEIRARHLSYWRQQLAGAPALLELPADFPRPPRQRFRGRTLNFHFPASLSDALRELGRRADCGLFTVVLAGFALLLARYSRVNEVVIGTTLANRRQPATEHLIGLFVNTLPLRLNITAAADFNGLLQQARDVMLAAHDHQDMPFEQLVDALEVPRSLGLPPLFQVMLTHYRADPPPAFGDAQTTLLEPDNVSAKFDLTLALEETAGPSDSLRGALEYNTDLFGAARMTRLIGHLQEVLTRLSARPDMPLAQLAWITRTEQQQLAAWNRTAKPYAAEQCIHQLFETQVARTPTALAVVAAHGDGDPIQLSYAALNRRANQLAHHLIRQGIEPGTCIGVCLPARADLIVALLGVLKAGAAYVPLDPGLPPARLTNMLDSGRVGLVVTETALRPRLPEGPHTLCLDAQAATIAAAPEDNPTGRADPLGPVYLIYTSGSTGVPKGAGVYHHSFVNLVQWFTGAFRLGADDRVLITSSPGFDLTQKNFFAPLITGGALHLSTAAPYEYAALRRHIAAWGITWLNCAPSAFYPFVEADEDLAALASLRYLFLGGESIALPRLRAWLQAPTCRTTLVNSYGPTECTDVVAAHVVSTAEMERSQEVPLGRPIANVGLHVLDAEQQPVAVDMPGELWISGACVGMGYPDDAELTDAKFKRLALAGDAPLRCYRTGDLVRRQEDGNLVFLGRIDHQVKVRGFRVELGEIEAALRRHPGVREAVVVKQAGAEHLGAYFTADGDAPVPAELRRHLQAILPDYMVPAAFMALAAFPLNASGKIERKHLPPLDAGACNEQVDAVGAAPPATPLESELIALWAELLETPSIGRHQDFFSLGGHSLLAVRMISRIRARFGLEIPVRAVFEAPTPAQLAQTIAAASASRAMPLPALPRQAGRQQTDLPPSFAQQRLWLLHRIEDLGSAYNIANAVRITGPLDVAALQQAVAALGQRHEILRTTFPAVSGEPVQRIHVALPVPWRCVDLRSTPEASQRSELERLLDRAASRAFDLEQGPLLEVTLYQLTGSAVLLILMHHIIADDESSAIWWRDLDGLYQAHLRQAPAALPELAVQYADFAVWQRETLRHTADGHLDYWRAQLADADTAPALPTDHPRPSQTSYRGATRQFTLEAALAARLYAQCRQLHVTPFMLFQTAFALLLCRYSGRDEIVIGAPVSNRGPAEVEGLIGFFVNTLPVRTRIDGNPTFSALLAQSRRTLLDAFEHAEMPFERLVSELNIPRSLDHAPLFQVLFIWQQALRTPPRLGDLQLTPWPLPQRSAKFDLSLFLAEQGSGAGAIDGALEYNSDLFDSATVDRMIGHLGVLLTTLAEDADAPVRTLSLLTAAEQTDLRERQRGPRLPTVTDCLHQGFEAQVARTPQATALIDTDGVAFSYQALNQRANRLAHYLQTLGVGPDAVVGLCLERSSELVICILAILKAGGAYLPVDAAYPAERTRYMLENADATLMLTQREQAARLPEQGTRTLYLEALELDDALAETNPSSAVTPENLLYVLYTSGSTGLPKAVAMPHRPLVNLVQWQLHEERLRDVGPLRTLQFAPISFDVSCQEIFATLLHGGTLVLVTEETRRDPYALLHHLGERRVERLFLPFVALKQLAEAAQKQPQPDCALREIITAGEQLQTTTAIRTWCRDLRCTLHNQYGPTETHVITAYTLPADTQAWPSLPPIGRPIANTEVLLLDAYGQPVPEGIVGELYLGGAGVARGYLNQPELSRERFLPNPHGHGLLYRSGDLGRYRPDGHIEYLGRADNQVKIRGYRVDPGEIETLLSRCPGVREAVVVAPEDGHGHKRLAAYVVADDAAAAEALTTRWKPFLQARLPAYMLPASLSVLERLPLTPSGKVDRRQLEQSRPSSNPPSAAPALGNALERRIAAIWQSLLGLDAIDSHDNFFDVGGHSLVAGAAPRTSATGTGPEPQRDRPVPLSEHRKPGRSLEQHARW
jgi:amino acid adenylation domain-containing protein